MPTATDSEPAPPSVDNGASALPKHYIHGQDAPMLRFLSRRTAETDAAPLVPHLKPGGAVLDVGCGPGSMTVGFARLVHPGGRVVGMDLSESVVAHAAATYPPSASDGSYANLSFQAGSAYALPFADASFDAMHANQVYQYLDRPAAALAEARRVLRPGGVLALRDAFFDHAVCHPPHPGLQRFLDLLPVSYAATGGNPDVARHLPRLAREAGFQHVAVTGSSIFIRDEEAPLFAQEFDARLRDSGMIDAWRAHGLVSPQDEQVMIDGMRALREADDGFVLFPTMDIVVRKPLE